MESCQGTRTLDAVDVVLVLFADAQILADGCLKMPGVEILYETVDVEVDGCRWMCE